MKDEAFYRWITFLKKIRFGWLAPFFLLLKGEDAKTQCKAIFSGVMMPIFSILLFLWIWDLASKEIVTKFGTVPGPRQVWSAWKSLGNETRLERIKALEHQHRAREKRIVSAKKYKEVLNDFPGEMPTGLLSPGTEDALSTSSDAFQQANELLEVYNKISITLSKEEAQSVAALFQYETSRQYAAKVIQQVLPLEIRHRERVEALRMAPEWNPSPDDPDKVVESKSALKKSESKKLAREKAILLIERQRYATEATKAAYALITSLPKSVRTLLAQSDKSASKLYPELKAWHENLLAEEAATGVKYAGKVKLKMLVKAFEYKPYPGKDTYFAQIATSLKTVFFGFCIASLIAIPIGIICGLSPNMNNAINPLIQIFKPVSPLAWLPIVMILVGALYVSDDPMFELSFLNSAITVALCSLWPTLVNTSLGVSSTDKDIMNVAKVLKLGWYKKVTKVIIPSAMPLIFTGLRLSLGVGWMVLIAAEMLAQNPGLGKFVWDMFQNGSSETLSMIMVAVFTIGIIGFMLDTIMLSLQELVSFD
jgi:ABC-type nitrate/sulfonate/bicarbonate transport system permease component